MNANFPKSSDLNIFYAEVYLNVNTVHSGCASFKFRFSKQIKMSPLIHVRGHLSWIVKAVGVAYCALGLSERPQKDCDTLAGNAN